MNNISDLKRREPLLDSDKRWERGRVAGAIYAVAYGTLGLIKNLSWAPGFIFNETAGPG